MISNMQANLQINNNVDIKKKLNNPTDVLLEILNKIYKNIKHNRRIENLSWFINVNREDIIKECNENIINEMEEDILKHFNRANICWYQRKRIKNYILCFIVNACAVLGYKFDYTKMYVTNPNKLRFMSRKRGWSRLKDEILLYSIHT